MKTEADHWWYTMGRDDERLEADAIVAALLEAPTDPKAIQRAEQYRWAAASSRKRRAMELDLARKADGEPVVAPPEGLRLARLTVAHLVETSLGTGEGKEDCEAAWRTHPESWKAIDAEDVLAVRTAAREVVLELRVAALGATAAR